MYNNDIINYNKCAILETIWYELFQEEEGGEFKKASEEELKRRE